ncbi:MAG: DUF1566 domain-containing protein [Desulfobacterales bacterium]|jgi:hypothetical protein
MDDPNTRNPLILTTDQTDCFDEFGTPADCRGTGQDGEQSLGSDIRDERFGIDVDRVVDRLTGFEWARDAALTGFPMDFSEAQALVADMNTSAMSGSATWRLPSRRQLFSLISHHRINPALPGDHPFRNVFNGYYWTGTTCARLPDQAWVIHLGGGRVCNGMKRGSYMVLPVSGPEIEKKDGKDRFIITPSTVRDRRTRRTWVIDPTEDDRPMAWAQALDRIRRMNLSESLGFQDWRVPNIRELESLCALSRHSPALAFDGFRRRIRDGYWSSTTSRYDPRYAWVLYTRDGAVGVGFKPGKDFHVMAVRGWEAEPL